MVDIESGWYEVHCFGRDVVLAQDEDIRKSKTKLFTLIDNQAAADGSTEQFEIVLKVQAAYLQAVIEEEYVLEEESAERNSALQNQFSDADALFARHEERTETRRCVRPQKSFVSTSSKRVEVPRLKDRIGTGERVFGSTAPVADRAAWKWTAAEEGRFRNDNPCENKPVGAKCQTFNENAADGTIHADMTVDFLVKKEAKMSKAQRGMFGTSQIAKWKLAHSGHCQVTPAPARSRNEISSGDGLSTPLRYAAARRFWLPSLWRSLLSKLLTPLDLRRVPGVAAVPNTDAEGQTRQAVFDAVEALLGGREQQPPEEVDVVTHITTIYKSIKWGGRDFGRSIQSRRRRWNVVKESAVFIVDEHILPFLYSLQTTHSLQKEVRDYCYDARMDTLFNNVRRPSETETQLLLKSSVFEATQNAADKVFSGKIMEDWKYLLTRDHGEKQAFVYLIRLLVELWRFSLQQVPAKAAAYDDKTALPQSQRAIQRTKESVKERARDLRALNAPGVGTLFQRLQQPVAVGGRAAEGDPIAPWLVRANVFEMEAETEEQHLGNYIYWMCPLHDDDLSAVQAALRRSSEKVEASFQGLGDKREQLFNPNNWSAVKQSALFSAQDLDFMKWLGRIMTTEVPASTEQLWVHRKSMSDQPWESRDSWQIPAVAIGVEAIGVIGDVLGEQIYHVKSSRSCVENCK